jgi:hypothetical protein
LILFSEGLDNQNSNGFFINLQVSPLPFPDKNKKIFTESSMSKAYPAGETKRKKREEPDFFPRGGVLI